MQIRIIIIGVLVGCSYLIGEHIYKSYSKRHKQLNDFIRILEIMRMDLRFGLYTLEEIFKRISDRKEYSFSSFFLGLSNDLGSSTNKTLEEIINDNVELLSKETYLQPKEIEEIKKMILVLGKSDVESQERLIDLSIENLKNLTLETSEEIDKKGSVYRKLATVLGIMIGIILI